MGPNVLLVLIDDLNSWIGALGTNPDVRTPNIDRLASRGALFTHAYCNAPYCNASRMSMFTGRLPTGIGVYRDEPLWDRPERPTTFVEELRLAGYYTFGAGKVLHGAFDYSRATRSGATAAEWRDLQNRPFLWDEFHSNHADPLPDGRPLNRMFDFTDLDAVAPPYHFFDWGPLPTERAAAMPDAAVVSAVAEFFRRPPVQPFFCAAGLYKPHLPWHVPDDCFALYDRESLSLPLVKADDLDDVPAIGRSWALSPPDHEVVTRNGQSRHAVHGYLASITYCDRMVGQIIDALDSSDAAGNTAIVLCSDNGFHLGEKHHWRKFTLWEEATRIPLIVVPPGAPGPPVTVHQPVSLVDVFPTLTELCDLEAPGTLDGTSLTTLMSGAADAGRPPAVSTWLAGNHSVRTGRWRLTRYRDGSEELYDHGVDTHEWTNLAGRAELDGVRAELARWLPVDAHT